MFPNFDFACLCGLCKQFTINFHDKLNVKRPHLLCKIDENFPLTSRGQVSYSKFNVTVWLKLLFPKVFHQNYCGKAVIQSLVFIVTDVSGSAKKTGCKTHIGFEELLHCLVIWEKSLLFLLLLRWSNLLWICARYCRKLRSVCVLSCATRHQLSVSRGFQATLWPYFAFLTVSFGFRYRNVCISETLCSL